VLLGSKDDWRERLKRLEEEIATSRQRREELREILDRLDQLNRQIDSLATGPAPQPSPEEAGGSPLPTGGEGSPPPGGTEPGPPGGGPEPAPGGWKARWRQAVLQRTPQAKLEHAETLVGAVASQMQAVEGSLDTACQFVDSVAHKLRSGGPPGPIPGDLVKEVVASEAFQQLVARLLASLLRETSTQPAHSTANPILCSKAGHPQATSMRKEVRAVKTQAPDPGFFWWIIIIVLIIVLLCFCFPLGAGAAQ